MEIIFYNCTYSGDDLPEDLKDFYNYVENGIVKSELTRKIDEAVIKGRKNEIWRTQYMKEWVVIQDARDEGIEQGEDRKLIKLICCKLRKGKSIPQIADELEEEETRIKVICDAAKAFAPDYDENKVIQAVEAIEMSV